MRIYNISEVGITLSRELKIKSSIFWDITPCSPLKLNQRFGGTCCLHLHGRRISQETSLFFDPNDGDDMFIRNVS
jgi:hypothetical protein